MILKHLAFPVIVPPRSYFLCFKQKYQEKKSQKIHFTESY